jgi:serine/threonine protein kinase
MYREVFSARDKKTGDMVAIKKIIIHNEKEGFPMTSLREIATLQRLQYDHIVPLLNVIVEPPKSYRELGDIYMVFPFMEHDLAGLLDTPTIQFSLPQIKCYMYQLLKGIFHLHKVKADQ